MKPGLKRRDVFFFHYRVEQELIVPPFSDLAWVDSLYGRYCSKLHRAGIGILSVAAVRHIASK
jgi:hypothetical protein